MDARENSNSKVLQPFDEQEQCISPCSSYSSINLFTPDPNAHFTNLSPFPTNDVKNPRANGNRGNAKYSFLPTTTTSSEASSLEHSSDKSESETDSSSSEVVGDVSDDDDDDEELSLDELMHDAKAMKKIELLAAMVGVDTTEPLIVLTEVVRVLKHLQRIDRIN